MKRLIVIILILLLVAGGGAGALIMLGIVPNPFAPPKPVLSAAEQAAAALDNKNKFHPPEAGLSLQKLDDMIVPVIINGQVRRRVFLTARLVGKSRESLTPIKAKLGAYQSAVLSDLIPFFQVYFNDHDMVELPVIKEKLVSHAKQVFGDDVTDVLLINVFEQVSGP